MGGSGRRKAVSSDRVIKSGFGVVDDSRMNGASAGVAGAALSASGRVLPNRNGPRSHSWARTLLLQQGHGRT
jgi:hypothetical protein